MGDYRDVAAGINRRYKDLAMLGTPDSNMSATEVERVFFEYSTRGPNDWVISGPIGTRGAGPGTNFPSADAAQEWVNEKYGKRVRQRIYASERGGRWAFLIAGEANESRAA